MTTNWLEADWPAPDFIKAGTTIRHGGVSTTPYTSFNLATHVGDELAAVNQNRATLSRRLSLPCEPHWLEQIHSTTVVLLPNEDVIPKADAVYTSETNIVCAVMTADCLPLLITDEQGSCVAAIHAGWRGLCDGVIESTIKKLPVEPESLLVWLGPAIGPDVYEVGKEVYDAFQLADHDSDASQQAFTPTAEQHWLLDMYYMARVRLNNIGVSQIYGGTRCTFSEKEQFFSYRRDGATGRMASLIWISN
ncbi:MAG: peptidoglycan editing factor PgeF [Gammaproteobacteria bacterium]|nr:peptidoglycan editing factor PgeF [Gammaproteobacteria bacterium]